jgi:hypothetical protein
MSSDSANAIVDMDAFRRSGWKSAISSRHKDGYLGMQQSLGTAARVATDSGNASEGRALWLLAHACSMLLNPSSPNEPFRPLLVMAGQRSSVPDDFRKEDVLLFSKMVDEIDDVWLRARIADLVWVLGTPRDQRFALVAIDAYAAIPMDTETWIRGGRECWERAVSLSLMLGRGDGDRLKQLEAQLLAAIEGATPDDGLQALWLAAVALGNKLGRDRHGTIARHLETIARHFDSVGDTFRSRDYYDASAEWFRADGDEAKRTEMIVLAAESLVTEAVSRLASEEPSNMVAASLYERAIQKYRTIPKPRRADYLVDERILELGSRLTAAGQNSLNEMTAISSPAMDISKFVEDARNAVGGKNAVDALLALANIHGGARVAGIRKWSEDSLRAHPLQALFPVVRMSHDGRVIAKRPGLSLDGSSTEDNRAVLWAEMLTRYRLELEVAVAALIWPALGRIQLEHRLREADFVNLCRCSPIVPGGRELIVGQALFDGYDKNFVGALHLLVPQIEHIVRSRLKAAGAKTTVLDSNGIENESGLSTLMELSEATRLFGEDLAFELKALFCDPFGPNLRNAVAHGLLDYDECASACSVYGWWLALRMVFHAYWHMAANVEATSDYYSI